MQIPQIADVLPELTQFIARLVAGYQDGSIKDWWEFLAQAQAFYTPERMARVDQAVPGWIDMSRHADGQTLIHVTGVLTALQRLPEYQQAAPDDQAIMSWMVMYHDVAKIPRPGQHDYIHGFRSAAVAGRGIAQTGFPVIAPDRVEAWAELTHHAIVFRDDLQEFVQDNGKLPEILSGMDAIFGAQSPASLVIKGVMLHLSIATDPEYPTVAPLTDAEIQRYIDARFCPLLKLMMLVDADGWNLYHPDIAQRHRTQTLDVFDRIAARIQA